MTLKKILLFLVPVIIIIGLIAYVGFNNFISAFSGADYLLLLLAFVPQIIIIILQIFRLNILLGGAITFRELFPIYIFSSTIDKLSPVGVAGEPVKAYLLKKFRFLAYTKTAIAIILERTMDMSIVGILFLISIASLGFVIQEMLLFTIYSLVISLLFISLVVIIYVRQELFLGLCRFGIRAMKKIVRIRRLQKINENIITGLPISRPSLLSAFLLTIVRWIFGILRTSLVIIAFGQPLNLSLAVLIVTVTTIITIVPVLPGGAGLVESVNTAIYSMFGLGFGVAFSISLFDRFISFYFYPFLSLLTGAFKKMK